MKKNVPPRFADPSTVSESTNAEIHHWLSHSVGKYGVPASEQATRTGLQAIFSPAALWSALLLLGGLLLVTGCQSSNSAVSIPPAEGTTEAGRSASPLHEGDVLRISFAGDTNLNTVTKVQLDGTINLQLVGDVQAAGKTVSELQADLMQRYQPLLRVNELTVNLVSTSASVYVSGAVLRPGRIPMDRPFTALEAIMEAGGLTPNRAKPDAVTVLRTENGQQSHYRVNIKKALRGEDPTPFVLKPFDVIFVPEKTFNF